ncbi:MAG: cytochrome C biogenesis protein CcdA [marine bacterium B5-7]|nr:MAG: cytochrome C biogenesis protein CcdA [marine bacterium B5-7]
MADIASLGFLTAFIAGIISFLSPCVLPLVPGYLSFIAGEAIESGKTTTGITSRLNVVGLSLCFIFGFSVVFIALGAGATRLGSMLSQYRYELNLIAGVIIIVFGLFMMGLLRLGWFARDMRFHGIISGKGGAFAAGTLGVAFAFGWTPCIGPILGAILMVATTSELEGSYLLGSYAMGLGLPFLLAAIFTDWFLSRARKLGRFLAILHRIAGLVLVIAGAAILTGYMSTFSIWMLKALPWLGSIG